MKKNLNAICLDGIREEENVLVSENASRSEVEVRKR
jgi:hypothetical protein